MLSYCYQSTSKSNNVFLFQRHWHQWVENPMAGVVAIVVAAAIISIKKRYDCVITMFIVLYQFFIVLLWKQLYFLFAKQINIKRKTKKKIPHIPYLCWKTYQLFSQWKSICYVVLGAKAKQIEKRFVVNIVNLLG